MKFHETFTPLLRTWTILAITSFLLDVKAFHCIVWLPVLLYVPGRLYLAIQEIDLQGGAETFLLSVCLSIVNLIAGGLILGLLHLLNPMAWSIWLATSTAFLLWKASQMPRPYQFLPIKLWRIGPNLVQAGGIGLAVLGAVMACVIALIDEDAERRFRYTELWVVPQASNTQVMNIGVRNAEGSDSTYEVEFLLDSATIAAPSAFSLPTDASWTRPFAIPPSVKGVRRFEVRLFKGGDHSRIYRRVFADVRSVGGV